MQKSQGDRGITELLKKLLCPQNFGNIHTDRETFSKNGQNRVQNISKHVNSSKTGCQKFP